MGLNFEGINPESRAKLENIVKDNVITKDEIASLTPAEKEALAKAFGGELPPIGDNIITASKVEATEPKDKKEPSIWQKSWNWAKEHPVAAVGLTAVGVGAAVLAGGAAAGTAAGAAIGKGLLALGGILGLSSCSKGFGNIDIDQNVNIKIDYQNDRIEDIYAQLTMQGESLNKIVDLLIENGRKTGEIIELLTKINIEEGKQTEMLEKLVGDNDTAIGYLKDIIDSVKQGNEISVKNNELLNQVLDELKNCKNDDTKETLNKILELLQQSITQNKEMDEQTHALLKEALNYIAAVGFEMNRNFGNLINEVKAGNVKLDELTDLVASLKALVEKHGTEGKELGDQILNYIAAVGYEMNRNFSAVLKAINEGAQGSDSIKALLEKVIENQDKNTKSILDAMGNIKVDGGNIDLSGLESMMEKLLEQSKANGETLASIDGKMDLMNITTKAILSNLEKEAGKNDVRYENIKNLLDNIKNKVGSLDGDALLEKLDKVLAKLDEIKDAIKDHKVTVDVTGKVTCECNCGKNHEGILGDIEDLMK